LARIQEWNSVLSNFFERRVSAYQVGVTGEVSFDDDF
jgi:ribonucleoside-diphosphate reductase beta chain